MNEATQEQLAELVKWLRETAQAGQAFVAGQAPDLAREIIAYGRVMEPLIAFGPVIAYSILMWRWAPKMLEAWDSLDDEFHAIGGWVFSGVGGLTSVLFLLNTPDAIKVWVAPKLYLLDYVAGLLK